MLDDDWHFRLLTVGSGEIMHLIKETVAVQAQNLESF